MVSPQGHVGLAHRRLAIIDLSAAAHQPMVAPGPTAISYNGEIYNYLELRAELAAHWRFRSVSDTECILAAYDRHGTGCLDHLRGMFAFALWDERRQRFSAPATASASSRSTMPWSAISSSLPPKPRRCCRFCPRSPPIPRRSPSI